jgi:hypothetical protein
MMLWTIDAPHCNSDFLSPKLISETLYEFNGPKIFTTAHDGRLYLWYECAESEDDGTLRYLVVPTDMAIIARLQQGRIFVLDALKQPWLWAVDIAPNGETKNGWCIQLEDIPDLSKPKPGVPLWPHLEPLISYRLIGEGLVEGSIPSSVVSRALNRPVAAIRRLLESVGNFDSTGRPEESFRKSYDLPTTNFAFNSFEVSFGLPNTSQFNMEATGQSIYDQGANLLAATFEWLHADGHENTPGIDMLEVLNELVPPANGSIVCAEVKGRLIKGSRTVVLTRNDRLKVRQAITSLKNNDDHFLSETGRIGEFDKDQMTLILRDRDSAPEDLHCSFTEELYDELYEAFESDQRVTLWGKTKQNRRTFDVLAMESAQPNSDSSTQN